MQGGHDMYETPAITELGTVEEFTRGPGGGRLDGMFAGGNPGQGGSPGGGFS